MNWLKSLSIRVLITVLMLLMALPAVGLIIHAGLRERENDLKEAARSSTYLLNSIAAELQSNVNASRQMMEMLSLLPEVQRRDSASVSRLLSKLLGSYPMYANILIADRTGMVWAGGIMSGSQPISLADRKAFRDAMKTGRFSPGEYVVGKSTQKPIINFAFPLRDRRGKPDGAILCGINLEQIDRLLKLDKLPTGTSFGIFDYNGVFIYRTIDPDKYIGRQGPPHLHEQMKSGPEEGVLDLVSSDGIHRLAAYRKIRLSEDQPPYAYIRGGIPVETTLKRAKAELIRNTSIMILSLLLVLCLILIISRRLIIERIEALQDASRQLAGGNLQVRLAGRVDGGELGRLGEAFDEMASALAREQAERSSREEVLREKSALLDLAHDAIILRDLEGTILFWNNGATDMYGHGAEQAVGRVSHNLLGSVFPRPLSEIESEVYRLGRWEGKVVHTAQDGRRIVANSRWVLQNDPHGNPWRIMETNSDVTQFDNAQNELLRMQKLESLGVLAGGIAHDFNNILTGIMGNVSLARLSLHEPDKAEQMLMQAEKASQRAADLAYRLLTFAKGSKPIKKVVDCRQLIEDCIALSLHGTSVAAAIDAPADLSAVEVDEGQMHQALQNIIINAVQAMPAGGTVTVTAENVILDGEAAIVAPGRYVRCTIGDTGCGIGPEDQKRIFDPYFTTKPGGKGLGLASVHSIISNHGGHISVRSTPGAGTTFEILLPASDRQAIEPERPASGIPRMPRKGGRILVMDDEESIRDLMSEMLKGLGYRATACSGGEEATALYARAREEGAPYEAVIMDLTIPGGMGGKEAAPLILAHDPCARLIVSSGYSNDPVMADHGAYGFMGTITKPYRIDQVASVLRDLLS